MFSLNYPLSSVRRSSEKLAPVPGSRQFIVLTEIKFAVMSRIIIIIIIIIAKLLHVTNQLYAAMLIKTLFFVNVK